MIARIYYRISGKNSTPLIIQHPLLNSKAQTYLVFAEFFRRKYSLQIASFSPKLVIRYGVDKCVNAHYGRCKHVPGSIKFFIATH